MAKTQVKFHYIANKAALPSPPVKGTVYFAEEEKVLLVDHRGTGQCVEYGRNGAATSAASGDLPSGSDVKKGDIRYVENEDKFYYYNGNTWKVLFDLAQTLDGNETDKAPTVKAVKDELDKKATKGTDGKIPESELPSEIVEAMKKVMYRGFFHTEDTLKAAHPTDVQGAYATVLSTTTMWMWDGAKWADTSVKPQDVNIINDLTTGGATAALSAEQGKALKGLIDQIDTSVTWGGIE